jgi:hypothetical protein
MANTVFRLLGGSLMLVLVGVVGKLLYSGDETISMGSVLLVQVRGRQDASESSRHVARSFTHGEHPSRPESQQEALGRWLP